MPQKNACPSTVSQSTRSRRTACHAPLTDATTPSPEPTAGTLGMARQAKNPIAANPASSAGATQTLVSPTSGPAAAVPAMIAMNVESSSAAFAAVSPSCGTSCGTIPYLAGLKSAAWTPISATIASAGTPPAASK